MDFVVCLVTTMHHQFATAFVTTQAVAYASCKFLLLRLVNTGSI